MNARKLLVLAGSVGLTLAARGALSSAAASPAAGNAPVAFEPLLDRAGRPAPGNVLGKGEPHDAGADGK